MSRDAPRRLARATAATFGVILLAAAGTFGGLWLWSKYTTRLVEVARGEAEIIAAAERVTPRGLQRESVLSRLNDREAAQFRSERPSKADSKAWCGEVNAKNRMGALVGFRRYLAVAILDPKEISSKLQSKSMSPEELKEIQDYLFQVEIDPDSSSTSTDQQAFDNRWSVYCY